MGRTGTLASILLHREAKIAINELVLELRKRRHRSLVVESSVKLNFRKAINIVLGAV
jgi:hypothetical protein